MSFSKNRESWILGACACVCVGREKRSRTPPECVMLGMSISHWSRDIDQAAVTSDILSYRYTKQELAVWGWCSASWDWMRLSRRGRLTEDWTQAEGPAFHMGCLTASRAPPCPRLRLVRRPLGMLVALRTAKQQSSFLAPHCPLPFG